MAEVETRAQANEAFREAVARIINKAVLDAMNQPSGRRYVTEVKIVAEATDQIVALAQDKGNPDG